MQPTLRVLKVHHFGEIVEDNMEITLAGHLIKMVATKDTIVQDRPVKETTVFFLDDSDPASMNLSMIDVLELEKVVGAYSLGEE